MRVQRVGDDWDEAMRRGQIATCELATFELLVTARDGADFDKRCANLDKLPLAPVTPDVLRASRHAFRQLARMGVLVGREARADSIATQLRDDLRRIKADACADAEGNERVMLVLWSEPPMTAGGGTWMTTLLETACLRNAFEDESIPWPTVGMESITARQPRYLLTSLGDSAGQRLAEFRAKPGWRDLEAVRAGRVIEIPGDLFARAGPTLPAAARAIVAERRRLAGR